MISSHVCKGLILGIEPTNPPGSMALGRDGKILTYREVDSQKQFSEAFLPHLECMLKETVSDLLDIEGVVICSGPGSFTGIRVGFSFAYGIYQARGVPIYPFPTLDVMAFSSPGGYELIIPALDAKKGEIYTAMYRKNASKISRSSDYISISPENLIYKIVSHKSFVFGPGYFRYRKLFNRNSIGPYPEEEKFIDSLNGKKLLEYFYFQENVQGVGPEDAQPVYVRPSEAERKLRRRKI